MIDQKDDSQVKKFVDGAMAQLAALRMVHVNGSSNGRHRPIPWVAIAGLSGGVLVFAIGVAWGGGSVDRTVKKMESELSGLVLEIKAMRKEGEDRSIAMQEVATKRLVAMKELSTEVSGLRKDYQAVEVQLASLGAMQGKQALLVVKLETRADAAKDDRSRLQQAATDVKWTVDVNAKYVSTLRQQMDVLWTLDGLPRIKPKEDG